MLISENIPSRNIVTGHYNVQNFFQNPLKKTGLLQLYQNETKIFEVKIPNLLFPSPLVYSPRNDSLIIQNLPFSVSSYLQENGIKVFYYMFENRGNLSGLPKKTKLSNVES